MGESRQYTTQLGAGLGMIQETLGLLRLWEPGDTPKQLCDKAIGTGVFSRATARRARNIVMEMFAPRFRVAKKQLPELQISYRQGKTNQITTRRPVIDIGWNQMETFADEHEIEIIIEAVDQKGNAIGWVSSGQTLNPATQGVRIRPGDKFGSVCGWKTSFPETSLFVRLIRRRKR